jgi:hypothetical protein
MKGRFLIAGGLAAALALAPLSSAWAQYARPYYYYSNPLLWPFQAAAAVVVGAATLVTLPFRAIAAATSPYPAYYGPPPYYYPPPPAYYPPASGYYAPRTGYYYRPQQGYYAPPGATVTPR